MKSFNDDKQMRSDWHIPLCNGVERLKVNGKKAHSTQKPAELLYRIIMSSSNYNDIILDPFMGSGTTGAVAKRLGRKFIGIEKETHYRNIAEERISKVVPLKEELLKYHIEKTQPKIPFGNLITSGLLSIGERIFSYDMKYEATINADSTLSWRDEVGSIHKISSTILKKSANNGWTFWYVKRNEKLVSINEIRTKYIDVFVKL